MKQVKQILNIAFNPHKMIVLSGILLTVILMIYIFKGGHKDESIAYISYLISAYSLIIVCVQIGKIIKNKFLNLAYKNKYLYMYIFDISFRSHISLCQSLAINICYAILHMGCGIYYYSIWSVTLSIYYCFLAIMRFLLLCHINTFEKDITSEFKQYRFCSIIILLINTVLSGVIILVIYQGKGFQYTGMLIYVMAMYAFYSIILAIINVIKYRKQGSPIIFASKAINLIVALVSMFSLETAMLSQFDTTNNHLFRLRTIGITGAVVCIMVFGIAMFMLIHSTIKLKLIKKCY